MDQLREAIFQLGDAYREPLVLQVLKRNDELSKETAMIKTRDMLTQILTGAAILLFLTFLFTRIAVDVLFQGVQWVLANASARTPASP